MHWSRKLGRRGQLGEMKYQAPNPRRRYSCCYVACRRCFESPWCHFAPLPYLRSSGAIVGVSFQSADIAAVAAAVAVGIDYRRRRRLLNRSDDEPRRKGATNGRLGAASHSADRQAGPGREAARMEVTGMCRIAPKCAGLVAGDLSRSAETCAARLTAKRSSSAAVLVARSGRMVERCWWRPLTSCRARPCKAGISFTCEMSLFGWTVLWCRSEIHA